MTMSPFHLTPEQIEDVRRRQAEDAAAWPGLPEIQRSINEREARRRARGETIALTREEALTARDALRAVDGEWGLEGDEKDLRDRLTEFLGGDA